MNENNNKMEYNDQKARDRQERKEKLESVKRKVTEKFNTIASDIADKKEELETKKRIKNQEKMDKEKQKAIKKGIKESSFTEEHTITNETLMHPSQKKFISGRRKAELTEQQKRQKKQKRQRIFRNIMTIPEIILIVLLIMFLKDRYIAYSKDVHQTLTYKAGRYIYEIKRDNDDINVTKKMEEACTKDPCPIVEVEKYQVKYSKKQMVVIRTYFDTIFKLKSKSKEVGPSDINSDIGTRSIRSIIHKDASFLDTKIFNGYQIVDYEQLGNNKDRGFIYEVENEKYYLTIALGPKSGGGYSLVVSEAHKNGNDLIFYITEQKPKDGENTMQVITHPSLKLQINERPGNIKVYDIETGEEYPEVRPKN